MDHKELTDRVDQLEACIRAYRQIFAVAMRDNEDFRKIVENARNHRSVGLGTPVDKEFARIHQQLAENS